VLHPDHGGLLPGWAPRGATAATVLVGTGLLALGPAGFSLVNVILVLVWLGLAVEVGREFARRVPARSAEAAGDRDSGGSRPLS
jgi:hypothetical protein